MDEKGNTTGIRAVVFDLEGTLLHAEALKALCFAHAATELRPDLDEMEVARSYRVVADRSRREAALVLLRRFELEGTARQRATESGMQTSWQVPTDLALRALDEALSELARILFHSYPRNAALARELHRSGRRTARCTDLSRRRVQRALSALGLDGSFDFVAAREGVGRGKPDPEIQLLAACELGVAPG